MTIDPNRPAVVATLRSEIEAAIVANFLVSEGIQAQIAGSSSRGGYSACQLEIQVAVRENDFERARALLADNRSTTPRHSSQIRLGTFRLGTFRLGTFRLGTWCLLVAMLAFFAATATPLLAWPVLMLFGFVSWEGYWRLMQRRREVSDADD